MSLAKGVERGEPSPWKRRKKLSFSLSLTVSLFFVARERGDFFLEVRSWGQGRDTARGKEIGVYRCQESTKERVV